MTPDTPQIYQRMTGEERSYSPADCDDCYLGCEDDCSCPCHYVMDDEQGMDAEELRQESEERQ